MAKRPSRASQGLSRLPACHQAVVPGAPAPPVPPAFPPPPSSQMAHQETRLHHAPPLVKLPHDRAPQVPAPRPRSHHRPAPGSPWPSIGLSPPCLPQGLGPCWSLGQRHSLPALSRPTPPQAPAPQDSLPSPLCLVPKGAATWVPVCYSAGLASLAHPFPERPPVGSLGPPCETRDSPCTDSGAAPWDPRDVGVPRGHRGESPKEALCTRLPREKPEMIPTGPRVPSPTSETLMCPSPCRVQRPPLFCLSQKSLSSVPLDLDGRLANSTLPVLGGAPLAGSASTPRASRGPALPQARASSPRPPHRL